MGAAVAAMGIRTMVAVAVAPLVAEVDPVAVEPSEEAAVEAVERESGSPTVTVEAAPPPFGKVGAAAKG